MTNHLIHGDRIPANSACLRLDLHGNSRSVYGPPSSEKLLTSVLGGEEYPCRLLPKRFQPKVILDVGAHVGAATLYFFQRYPEAQIYCYEPCLDHFSYLELNTAGIPNIRLHGYGLHNQSTDLPLYKPPYATNSLLRPRGSQTPDFDLVKVVRASEELVSKKLTNISLLKLDVEGSELEILSDIFANVKDLFIICMFIEYHNAVIAQAIREMLSGLYDIQLCHEHNSALGVMMLLDKRCGPLMR